MSGTNLGDSNLTKSLLCKASEQQILWQLTHVTKHPCLIESHIDVAMSKHKSNELLLQHCQNWTCSLHVMRLCGMFLSNWHFVEYFLCNLHRAYNGTVKPLLLHFVWHIKVNVAPPHYLQPINVLFQMTTAAVNVGVVGMTPLQTPKEFADSCCQQPRSAAPVCAIQHEDATSTPSVATTAIVDICQLDDGTVNNDPLVAICSLPAANPHTCDTCGVIDHVFGTCPRLQKMMFDPVCVHCTANATQQG